MLSRVPWFRLLEILQIATCCSDFHHDYLNNVASEMFVANDGGVFKLTDFSDPFNSWENLNSGLGVGTAYDCSTSQNGKRTLAGSFHDMGCIIVNENNNVWSWI